MGVYSLLEWRVKCDGCATVYPNPGSQFGFAAKASATRYVANELGWSEHRGQWLCDRCTEMQERAG